MATVMFVFLFSLLSLSHVATPQLTDANALLLLKDSFRNTEALSSWSSSSPSPCGPPSPWQGVVCLHGIVTGLRLAKLGLSGTVEAGAFVHFKGLRTISLNDNNFSGSLPRTLGQLKALKSLFLSNNQFSGTIPDDFFASMNHVKKLWIDNNNFSGPIPSSIFKSSRLIELRIDGNSFEGGFPSIETDGSLKSLGSLKSFNASNNHISGPIPTSLSRFDASSFVGNPQLCGPPVSIDSFCSNVTSGNDASTKHGVSRKPFIIAIVVVLVIIALLCVGFIWTRKRRRDSEFKTLSADRTTDAMEAATGVVQPKHSSPSLMPKKSSSSRKSSLASGSGRGSKELVMINEKIGRFGLTDLMKAYAEVLGNGSLGSAYKAVMANGISVAVKRMRDMNRVGEEAFSAQLQHFGRLQHPNVLTPLAYHYRKEEKLIVSEYVPKGSLLYILHGDRGDDHNALNWPTRLKIARGIARGMTYLQTELSSLELAHGNLKSGNILLTNNYEPIIVDYGFHTLINAPQIPTVMFSYKSPEGLQHNHVSSKSDVYCLGVVLLELLSGKFPSQYLNNTKGGTDIVQWTHSAFAEGRECDVLDQEVVTKDSSVVDGMVQLLKVGAACTQPDPEQRPEMQDIVAAIEKIGINQTEGEAVVVNVVMQSEYGSTRSMDAFDEIATRGHNDQL